MWDRLKQAWKVKEVRDGILFVIAMMAIFRLTAAIPLPGIDLAALRNFFASSQFLGLLNLFSGGTLSSFSIVALGVAPYITASIIFQLLAMIVPQIEELQKEGEQGQRKINQWTRLLTVPLAVIQSFALIGLLQQSQVQILTNTDPFHIATIIFALTGGTMFLTWIGELMSEKKVGNGISLLIFAGILAEVPNLISQFAATYDSSQLFTVIVYILALVLMLLGIVYVNEGQRNIPVQYARQARGMSSSVGGVASSLPLRVNMGGVIPIIFAISLLLLPSVIGQFLVQARSPWLADAARWVLVVMQDQWVYGVSYFLLVFGFTFFYTGVIFHPDRVAENIQRNGGFIPGIRPGKPTAEYLQAVVNRVTLGGALFLSIIAVAPLLAQGTARNVALTLGGTSLLIIISVVIEALKQIESQITMREYDAY